MAFFNMNTTYNVWERKGLAYDRSGRLSISESDFSQGEVLPEHDLKYLGKKVEKFEAQHALQLPDGRIVKGHRNHFDITTDYNKGKLARRQKDGATTQPETPETKRERLRLMKEKIAAMEMELKADEQAEEEIPAELIAEAAGAVDESVPSEDSPQDPTESVLDTDEVTDEEEELIRQMLEADSDDSGDDLDSDED